MASKSTPFKPGKKGGEQKAPPPSEPSRDDPPTPTGEDGWADPEGCPLSALGHRNGVYYFLTPSGEFRSVSDRGLTTNGISSLFDGKTGWAIANFPLYGKGERVVGFDHQQMAAYLMRQCVAKGLFNPDTPLRGPGVWVSASGDLIVHAGDALYVDRKWSSSGQYIDGTLYPAWPKIDRPALRPAKVTAGLRLMEIVRTRWRFKTPRGADLVVGWMGAAMLGGAPSWRAHFYLNGANGTGKTWFCNLVAATLGAGAHEPDNNTSEAGLRQSLTGEARAMIFDESEPGDGATGKGRIAEVIEVLRSISSGKGSRSTRGTSGHTARKFTVTGCAFLSSVLHAPLKPQDRARFMLAQLDTLPKPATEREIALFVEGTRAAIAEMAAQSPFLRARAIAGWGFYQECFALYRAKFMAPKPSGGGCSARAADQIATILAGRDLLCCDETPGADSLDQAIADFDFLIEAAEENDAEGEGQQCLTKLYSAPAELWRSGERYTVGEVVMRAMARETDREGISFRRTIKRLGLRLEYLHDMPFLLVANNHEALAKIFHGSRWADSGWSQALRMLDGVRPWEKSMRFSGTPRQRCTALHGEWLPGGDDEDETKRPEKGEPMPTPIT